MNIERMEAAIKTLEQVEAKNKKFDMSNWATDLQEVDGRFEPSCGTSACAFGYCALDPWHKSQGLGTESYLCKIDETLRFTVTYDSETDIIAAAHYFDISLSHAEYLFYPSNYYPMSGFEVKPIHVIKRIKNFLEMEDATQL